jgi:hypothetical protein
MGLFDIFSRKKTVLSEKDRRDALLKNGRIAEGTIIDSDSDVNGREVVYYVYSIHGVDFESSDALTEEQKSNILAYAPGAKVSIRFDNRNPGNSVLV